MVHIGPVRILDLRDKLAFQPAAFGHLVSRETLTHLPLLRWGRFEKGQVLISSLWKRSKTFAVTPG